MIKDSIVNLKKSLRMTLQNVPAVVDTLIRGLDEVEDAADEQSTYSETEHVVGKWIDGNDIYEKVVDTGAMPNTTTKNVNHEIANLDKIIDFKIIAYSSSTFITIPYMTSGFNVALRAAMNATQITIGASGDYSSYANSHAIIRYTKSATNRSPENDTKNGGDEPATDPDVKIVDEPAEDLKK